MKTIIVATDFSTAAENASNYSVDLALALHSRLHLLHIFNLPVSYAELPLTLEGAGMTEAFESKMDKVREDLVARTNGKLVITTEVRTGPFFQQLKEVCEEKQPVAVVMGAQGTTAAERFFFGGHTVNAMKHLPWPLISVPSGVSYRAVKRIGLACDLENAGHSIPKTEIETLVRDFGAELHILNSGKQNRFKPEIVFESVLLEEIFKDLRPNVHFITSENAGDSIMEFAEKNEIDLLLVIPLHHSLIDRFIHHSHTRQFVLHSHIPVLAVHPKY